MPRPIPQCNRSRLGPLCWFLPVVCRAGLVVCLAGLVVSQAGPAEAGVRRRRPIRSNPPGARGYVDDQEIGVTPVSTSFIYYGTRKIQLLKDGFETLTVKQKFRAPWYQYTPIDFFSENLWPAKIRDERVLDFQLIPMRNVPNQELRSRGEELRLRSRRGIVTPIPGFQGSVNPGSQVSPNATTPTPAGVLPPPSGTLPRGGMPLPAPPSRTETLPRGGLILPDPAPPRGSPVPPTGYRLPPLDRPGAATRGLGPLPPPQRFAPAPRPYVPAPRPYVPAPRP